MARSFQSCASLMVASIFPAAMSRATISPTITTGLFFAMAAASASRIADPSSDANLRWSGRSEFMNFESVSSASRAMNRPTFSSPRTSICAPPCSLEVR